MLTSRLTNDRAEQLHGARSINVIVEGAEKRRQLSSVGRGLLSGHSAPYGLDPALPLPVLLLDSLDRVLVKLCVLPVMKPREVESDGVHVVPPEQVMRVVHVPFRLRHLPPVDREQPGVHPVPHKGLETGECLNLANLGLVVGVDQLARPAMYVVLRTEVGNADGRILDVPPRRAESPRTLPSLLRGRSRAPEREVDLVSLLGRYLQRAESEFVS